MEDKNLNLKEQTDSSEHEIRLKKIEILKEKGINPWPSCREVNATCEQVIKEFKEDDNKEYDVAGRLVNLRLHGKTAFGNIQDRTGKLQIYFKQDIIGEEQFQFLKELIDIGDIIWIHGISFKTKTREITIKVKEFRLQSKCLHPLPEKFHGLVDVEKKYRQRYLDLISNEESKEKFKKRSEIVKGIRTFLDSYDFLEVETPMLHPIAGGAAAKPFVTHFNALDDDFYLRIAPELYLKRLVVGGFERVYEINRSFRNEGVSTRHNPEFTMLEFYMAHKDYHYIMGFVEEMFRTITKDICGKLQVPYGDYTIDFEKPFDRLSMKDATIKYGNISTKDITPENVDSILKEKNIKLENKNASFGKKLETLFEELAEKKLIQPTFIIDYPIEISPLAKRDLKNPDVAARFELYIAAMEIGNGFNELNDPFDQSERFKEQVRTKAEGDEEAHNYDADYILALEHGLSPTVGVGVGIDRLTMLLTDTQSIRDVILFPTLKKKVD